MPKGVPSWAFILQKITDLHLQGNSRLHWAWKSNYGRFYSSVTTSALSRSRILFHFLSPFKMLCLNYSPLQHSLMLAHSILLNMEDNFLLHIFKGGKEIWTTLSHSNKLIISYYSTTRAHLHIFR